MMLCKPQIFYFQDQLLRILGLEPPSVFYIGGSDTLPSPLAREDEEAALTALESGDEEARKSLIEHNLRLVVYIAKRFENTGINIEDLISIGTIGLIKAVNTFNSGKNIKLATYASRCIENEILMHLRKVGSQRSELSFDEPLNTDWDGNELLLSDILGTDEDDVSRGHGHLPELHQPSVEADHRADAAGDAAKAPMLKQSPEEQVFRGYKLSTKPKGFADRGDAAQRAHSRRKSLAHFWAEKCFFRGACPRKKRI